MPRLPFSRAPRRTCIMLMALVGLRHMMTLPQLASRMRESMSACGGWERGGGTRRESAA